MERLLLITLLVLCLQCTADEFCSLTVHVRDQRAVPVDTWVTLTTATGRTLKKLTSDDGTVEFCDLGVQPVTIQIGSGSCNELTLRNVSLPWKRGKVVMLTYEPCFYEQGDLLPRQGCTVMLRVVDSMERPLANARVLAGRSATPQESDRYGRVFLQVASQSTIEGTVTHPTAATSRFSVQCSRTEPIEQTIILDHQE